jgi:hypothetical protein
LAGPVDTHNIDLHAILEEGVGQIRSYVPKFFKIVDGGWLIAGSLGRGAWSTTECPAAGFALLFVVVIHPSRKIAEMKPKTALFELQGTGGKRDVKNKKIVKIIAK